MRRTSGSVYLLALVATVVAAGIAAAMSQGLERHLGGARAQGGRDACRTAALGALRAIVADLDAAMAAKGPPALAAVDPAGVAVDDVVVVLVGGAGDDGRFRFALRPLAGLADISHAPPALLAALPGMDQARAAAVADWRDADDAPDDAGGAERSDAAYAAAPVPYAPRNAPFESLDELALVRGIDAALWAGEDRNANGVLDPGEDDDRDGRLAPGLAGLCTVESREPANAPDGTPRTSCARGGAALRARLIALLGEERGLALAAAAQRAQPFANRLDFLAAVGAGPGECAALWPYLVGPEGRLGLVDAASAPAAVLAAAAGAEWGARIAAARTGAAGPGWLVAALGREGAAAAGSRLTVGCWRFRADLLAVKRDGSGWERLWAELDCSTGSTRVVSLRPAASAGWPLPWAPPAALRADRERDGAAILATGMP